MTDGRVIFSRTQNPTQIAGGTDSSWRGLGPIVSDANGAFSVTAIVPDVLAVPQGRAVPVAPGEYFVGVTCANATDNYIFLTFTVTTSTTTAPTQPPATPTTLSSTTSTTVASVGGGAGVLQSPDPLLPGRSASLIVPGLTPGAPVNGTLQSTPVNLPTVTTDSAGTAVFAVMLPSDFEAPGTHMLTVRSATTGVVLTTIEFTVDGSGRIVSAVTIRSADRALARTGGALPIRSALVLGVVLVVFGGALLRHRVPAPTGIRED